MSSRSSLPVKVKRLKTKSELNALLRSDDSAGSSGDDGQTCGDAPKSTPPNRSPAGGEKVSVKREPKNKESDAADVDDDDRVVDDDRVDDDDHVDGEGHADEVKAETEVEAPKQVTASSASDKTRYDCVLTVTRRHGHSVRFTVRTFGVSMIATTVPYRLYRM
jgi:hypothetical protein